MAMPPLHYGFVGTLDITDQGRKIRLLKFGFDFDYNPVCFVAMGGKQNGTLNYGTGTGQEWTKEDLIQFPGINSRSPFDELAWNKVVGHQAQELRRHTGLWALRGDRVEGMNVGLAGRETVRIERVQFQGKLVWDVHVEGMARRT